jgi:hypothetical protein
VCTLADVVGERTQRLDLRMSPDEMSMLEELAEITGVTASDIVRMLIRKEHQEKCGKRGRG